MLAGMAALLAGIGGLFTRKRRDVK
ncbi:MAG TPA: LPXTG cell wall anchor domain-containing protein [Bacillota bacterium]